MRIGENVNPEEMNGHLDTALVSVGKGCFFGCRVIPWKIAL